MIALSNAASRSLASGSLAMVSWYLIERACFVDLGVERIANDALRFVLAFDGRSHDRQKRPSAVELELTMRSKS